MTNADYMPPVNPKKVLSKSGTATAVGKLVSIASNGREIVPKKTVITYRVKWQAPPIQASSDSLLQCKSFPQLGITLPITKANPRPH